MRDARLLAMWSVIMQLLRQILCKPSKSPSTIARCKSSPFDLHAPSNDLGRFCAPHGLKCKYLGGKETTL